MIHVFVDIPGWVWPVMILLVAIIIACILISVIPALKIKKNEKTEQEIATDEVEEIIIEEKPKEKNEFHNELQRIDDTAALEKAEERLNIIFTDTDIESLLIQMEQDRIDDAK